MILKTLITHELLEKLLLQLENVLFEFLKT